MISAKIVPFGNSLGVRLPKAALESIGANSKDTPVEIELAGDAIIIRRQETRKSFERLMEDFYQKPFDEIDVRMDAEELDWGEKRGDEVW